jgi:hypothetical protein
MMRRPALAIAPALASLGCPFCGGSPPVPVLHKTHSSCRYGRRFAALSLPYRPFFGRIDPDFLRELPVAASGGSNGKNIRIAVG